MTEISDHNTVLARNEDVVLYTGSTHQFVFELVDECGSPLDFTDRTVRLRGKTNPKHPTLTWDILGVTSDGGIVKFDLTTAELDVPKHVVAQPWVIHTPSGDEFPARFQFTVAVVRGIA